MLPPIQIAPTHMQRYQLGLVWLRRDLRLYDHAALAQALEHCQAVVLAFVFDRSILDSLPQQDRRVEFICTSLQTLSDELRQIASNGLPNAHKKEFLLWHHGVPEEAFAAWLKHLPVQAVFAAWDDEASALQRDQSIGQWLQHRGISLHLCKDHMVFARQEILTGSGKPYSVFTPYKRAWLKRMHTMPQALLRHDTTSLGRKLHALPPPVARPIPALETIGFAHTHFLETGGRAGSGGGHAMLKSFLERLSHYHALRDFPAENGTSCLGMHLRFGTLSIRELCRAVWPLANDGQPGAQTWLSELIWRDFYLQVLANYPHVAAGLSFKRTYDTIAWEQGPVADTYFEAWRTARTGYPLVDAAMQQLLQTGYMHNRLRMVSASFLCKHLGINWRRGEAWFARHLNDFEWASNNGGWQWASSSGCDAQPYFRIFNPVTQSQKFDPKGQFIRQYLPQLAHLPAPHIHAPWQAPPAVLQAAGLNWGHDYPLPIVEHHQARAKTLERYAAVRKSGQGFRD